MDGRDLISKTGKLSVFIDSVSLEDLLSRSNPAAQRLMLYHDAEMYEFVRSAKATTNAQLNSIVQVERRNDPDGALTELEITRRGENSRYGFGYRPGDIEATGKVVFSKNLLRCGRQGKDSFGLHASHTEWSRWP